MRKSTIAAVCGVGLWLTGCCDSSKRHDPPAARIGETVKVPESDFSVTVDKGEVTDSLAGDKPKLAGARWVAIKFRLKNESPEPRDSLLELGETLRVKGGAIYEPSTDGAIGLLLEEPGWSEGGLDKVPPGKEIKQVKVFAVPSGQAHGEVELVLEKLMKIGPPNAVSIAVPLTERPVRPGGKP